VRFGLAICETKNQYYSQACSKPYNLQFIVKLFKGKNGNYKNLDRRNLASGLKLLFG
jgi:hypothetical protein